jgi:hypothetical protein
MKKITINSLDPLPIKVEDIILIGSINNNTFDWQVDKTIEELLKLAVALTEYRKNKGIPEAEITKEYICPAIGNATIQLGILYKLFPVSIIQSSINGRLASMEAKNRRLNTPKIKNIGFKANNGEI